jgi:hypothetical protein
MPRCGRGAAGEQIYAEAATKPRIRGNDIKTESLCLSCCPTKESVSSIKLRRGNRRCHKNKTQATNIISQHTHLWLLLLALLFVFVGVVGQGGGVCFALLLDVVVVLVFESLLVHSLHLAGVQSNIHAVERALPVRQLNASNATPRTKRYLALASQMLHPLLSSGCAPVFSRRNDVAKTRPHEGA